MADQIQLRGGTAAESAAFTGASREVTVDTTNNTIRVHDGSTQGGHLLAKQADLATAQTVQTNALAALGIASGATSLGAFTGSTIGDNQTAKAVLQVIETLLENKASVLGTAGSATNLGTFTGATIADNQSVKQALQALETTLEAVDIDTDDMATLVGLAENVANLGTFTGSTIADNDSIKDALQSLETATELRATIDSPTFTTKIQSPEFHSAGSHLKFKADTNDIIFYPNNIETLQITRHSGTGHPTFTANGGSGEFVFNQIAEFAGGITIGGVAVSAGNNADAVIGVGGVNHLGTFTGSVIADNQTIKQALQALETEVDASGNEAVGDLVALSGVAANAVNLGTFTGSTIGDSLNIKAALQALETTLEAVDIDTDDMATLVGLAENVANLGTFSGSTIADNDSIKDALQALETATELRATLTDVALKANLSGATFTGDVTVDEGTGSTIKLETTDANSAGIHIEGPSGSNGYIDTTNGFGNDNLQVYSNLLWARALGGGSGRFMADGLATFNAGISLDGVSLTTVQIASESFADNDTSLMTSAAIADYFTANAITLNAALTELGTMPTTTAGALADLTLGEVAILDGATVTTAELNLLDGITAGTVSASLAVIADSDKDVTGFRNVTLTGELDAATGDFSGDVDIDGTTNLDVVDIDGATQIDATVTVGVDDTGYDVKFFGDAAGAYMLWDTSADDLILGGEAGLEIPNTGRFILGSNVVTQVNCALAMRNDLVFSGGARNIKFKDNTYNACRFQANNGDIFMGMDTQGDNTIFFQQPLDINTSAQIDGTFTVGVDDTGYDVKFFGATASAYLLWDESEDDLILGGAAGLIVPDGQFTLGSTAVTSTAAELNYVDGVTSNVQTQLDAKAALAGPTFTGTPAAPTAGAGTNTTQLATTAFVATAIAATIDSAPGALDTLNELAAALGDDANFSTTVTNLISANETHIDNVATLSGVAKDSTHLATFTGSTISDNQTVKAAIQALETAVETKQATDAELTELATMASATAAALADLTEAEVQILDGATLSTTELNYVDGVTSAIQTQLDAKLASSGAQAALHVDHIITLSGVAQAADDLGTFSGGTIADSATIKAALQALETKVEAVQTDVDGNESDADTAIAANETHIDNAVTLTGVAKDSTHLATFTGSTIADSATIKAALQALETKVEAVQTDVDGNESDADTAIAANETHIDNAVTLTGVAKDSTHLGTFSGSTISDNGTVKAGIQELETAVETKAAAANSNLTGTTVVAAIDLSGDIDCDGTANLDAVDIDGDVDIAGDLTFSAAKDVHFIDNNAAALEFAEAGNAYLTFVTTDGSEAVKVSKNLDIDADDIDVSTQVTDIKIIDNQALALRIMEGTTEYLRVTTTNSGEKIDVSTSLQLDGTVDINGAVDCSGDVTFSDAQSISITDNLGFALRVVEGSNEYVRFVTTDGSEHVDFSKSVKLDGGMTLGGGISVPASQDITMVASNSNAIDFVIDGGNRMMRFNTNTETVLMEQNIDVDGTANLDVVDIDGAVDMASTLIMSGGLTNAADDTAAASAGVAVNQLYRNGSIVMIRVS